MSENEGGLVNKVFHLECFNDVNFEDKSCISDNYYELDDSVNSCYPVKLGRNVNIQQSPITVFYFRKHWYQDEKVSYSDNFREYIPNLGELLINLLNRISGRFTPMELEYIARETGKNPVYDLNEGHRNVYSSTSKIRSMLKVWKEAQKSTVLPLSSDQMRAVEAHCDQLESSVRPSDQRVRQVPSSVYLTLNTQLPMIVGCIVNDNNAQMVDILADSGASISLLRKDVLLSLGLSLCHLSEKNNYSISTATTKSSSALGSIQLGVYLLAKNQKYYKIMVKFVVIDAFIPAVVIGIPDLRRLQFAWTSNGQNEELVLNCMSSFGKQLRRAFLTNVSQPCKARPPTDNLFTFCCNYPLLIFDDKDYKIMNCNSKNSVVVSGSNIVCNHELDYVNNWPVNIVTTCHITGYPALAGLHTEKNCFFLCLVDQSSDATINTIVTQSEGVKEKRQSSKRGDTGVIPCDQQRSQRGQSHRKSNKQKLTS